MDKFPLRSDRLSVPTSSEVEKREKTKIRVATPEDIERLVEIDLECFDDVYGDEPPAFEEVYAMLASRQNIAGELMLVGEVEGRIEGFMTCQVTDKKPEDFINWEKTTDNGYIATTHNPSGNSFYVVNLTTTPKGSKANLSDLLITNMYGRFLEQQKEIGQLLSRMPHFDQWLEENNINFENLTPSEQDNLAAQYVKTTKIINGKEVLYDGMLRRYKSEGAEPVKVVRDGFQDPTSRNYGVLCVFESPMPQAIRHNKLAAKLAGKGLKLASQHPKIVEKFL